MLLETERAEVAAAALELLESGLVRGTSGNVSVRVGELVAVTPTGVGYRRMEAAQVPVIDLDGAVVEGAYAPSSEVPMHLAVYGAREDIAAVVHTHSMFATTFAALGEELPAVHYILAFAGTKVRVAPYATYGTEELAANCASALGQDQAVLLANHGVIAVGDGLRKAMVVAEAVEFTAELYWRARCLGAPNVLPEAEMHRVAREFRGYGQPRQREAPS
jgi:L-fuculose-phosphate aldolase